ncbi:MAG: alanine:cation symporter family protein [Bacilli bacterium]|nr:alanine:cation symporter family protein [Bacilli bacterium]
MIETLKDIMWAIVTVLIIVTGIQFSIKLRFPQLKINKIINSLKNTDKQGISPIKTLFLTLAGRIGVGSIAGVALAIYIGGPGTIFWMWVIAIISGVLAYTETLLSIKYKDIKNNIGGPSHYIKKGLNKKTLAITYSIIVIVAYLIGFIPIQSNTIVKSLDMIEPISHIIIGIILSIISLIVIKGGINKISKVTDKLVPLMTILYISMALFVVITNIEKFPTIIQKIITEAFNLKPFFSGFIVVVLIGVQRAIFSNESGIGLGGIAASASNSTDGTKSGYIQVLGIYITTIIICTATAFMILIFDYQNIIINNPNGIELTSMAFNHHFGSIGNTLLVLCILLFSFSTILTGYYYCESSLKFISKQINTKALKTLTPLSVLLGTITSPTTIWALVDILVAILALINIYAMVKLKDEIITYHNKKDEKR